MESAGQKKEIFIVVSDPANIKKAAHYLEQKAYNLTIFSTLPEVISTLKIKRPEVILLSWNLRNMDVVKIYTVLSRTFNFLCIVFPEENSSRNVAAIVRSRIPHTVFPPLSGPSFERRIESLHRMHQEYLKNLNSRRKPHDLAKKGLTHVQPQQVPSETTWKKAEVDETANLREGESVWKGTPNSEDYYYIRGEKCPEYDQMYKAWRGIDQDATVVRANVYQTLGQTLGDAYTPDSQSNLRKLDQEVLPYLDLAKNHKALTSAPNLFEELLEDHPPSEELESNLNSSRDLPSIQHLILKCASDALTGWNSTFPGLFSQPDLKQKLSAIAISTERFTGYLVFMHPDIDPMMIKAYFDIFIEEMKSGGEHFLWVDDPFFINLSISEFDQWLRRHDQSVSVEIEGKKITLAFVKQASLPKLEDHEGYEDRECYIGFDRQEWLLPNSTLTFDLYLNLPQNQKYILYLKKGESVCSNRLGKFAKFRVKTVFLLSSQRRDFFSYCLENMLKGTDRQGI